MNRFARWITAFFAAGMLAACGGGGGAVVNVSIDAQTTLISLAGRTQLTASVTGSTNTAVSWTTSDSSVATVDANGIVEANGEGDTDITATSVADATKSATITITVGDFVVDGVTISAPSTTVEVGNDLQLDASVQPSSVPQGVLWSTDDSAVATIDSDGLVTGQSAGTVVVTARSAADIDVQAQITITVVASGGGGGGNVSSVTIDDPNPTGPDEVQLGGTLDLTVTVVADPGTSTDVTWSSADDAVATIDGDGLVTGVVDGTVTITATSVIDTSVSDTIDITVIDGTVTGVSIDNRPPGNELLVGVTRDLDATVAGTGTFGQDVLWTSSAPAVATIDVDGMVTGVGVGTTVITAVAASDTNVDDSFTLSVIDVSVDCSSASVLTDIDTDTVLPLGCYTATGVVSVTAALTLQAGTIIEFGSGARIEAGIGGSITANGSGAAPIVFRGANPSTGYWDGVRFISFSPANNSLDFVEISDAGSGGYAGVYVDSTGSVSITNSRISNSTVGLDAKNGGTISAFANNEFRGNDLVADIYAMHLVQLDAASDYDGSDSGTPNTNNHLLVRSGDVPSGTWPATDASFRVSSGDINIVGDVVVSPGATIEFGAGARLDVDGSLNATGTSTEPITFRGYTPSQGVWDGINIISGVASMLDFVDVSHGGAGGWANLYVQDTGNVSVFNSSFTDSSGFGIEVEAGGTITPSTEADLINSTNGNNTFSNNTDGPTNL
ncbi:MAG: Ig-like domain-containing protein [Trueperaceae bacterium]